MLRPLRIHKSDVHCVNIWVGPHRTEWTDFSLLLALLPICWETRLSCQALSRGETEDQITFLLSPLEIVPVDFIIYIYRDRLCWLLVCFIYMRWPYNTWQNCFIKFHSISNSILLNVCVDTNWVLIYLCVFVSDSIHVAVSTRRFVKN